MSIEQHKAKLQSAVESFNNKGNRTGWFDLYANNAVLHDIPPELPRGIEGVKMFYNGLWAAFPDCHLVIEDVVGEGNKLMYRLTLRGTHQGDFMGIPATGKRVEITGITELIFEGGKCIERWSNIDKLGMMQQLGAIPAGQK